MDGENLGLQEKETGSGAAQENSGTQADETQQALTDVGSPASGNAAASGNGAGPDVENGTEGEVSHGANETFKRQLKERDEEIAKLRAQVAEAAKSTEKEAELNKRIADLEARAESERIDYELTLAGCRSTRAGRVLLEDYDGDIAALKEAEPWLFAESATKAGVTGLPNAGAATNEDSTIAHWREIAGLENDD